MRKSCSLDNICENELSCPDGFEAGQNLDDLLTPMRHQSGSIKISDVGVEDNQCRISKPRI